MKAYKVGGYFFAVVILLFATSAQSQLTTQAKPTPQADIAIQKFYQQTGRDWVTRWSSDGVRVLSLVGREAAPGKAKGFERVQEFLRQNAMLFGLVPDLGDLKLIYDHTSKICDQTSMICDHTSVVGQHYELQQMYQGLPVENGRLKVNLDKEGRVLDVKSSYLPDIRIEKPEPSISETEATERAIAKFLEESAKPKSPRDPKHRPPLKRDQIKLKEPPKVERVIFLIDDGKRAIVAYKVLINAEQPVSVMEFIVNGQTGEILRIHDYIKYAVNGQGQVFIPNPVNALNDNTLRDQNDSASAVPAGAYTNVTLWNLDNPINGQHRLTGLYVKSDDIEAPHTTLVTETGTNFNYNRSQAGFEETMLYYHIDRSQRYIQTLGFVDVNNRQIRVDAHGCTEDNSWHVGFPAGAGYLKMCDGGADGGEDADIILHEYGHAIQDNQNPGAFDGAEGGAIGEGFGDYWATSSFRAESWAAGWNEACFAEWDWLNDAEGRNPSFTDCSRNVANTLVFTGVTTEIHADGEFWSGALWDALQQLGKTTADRLALQSHFNMPTNPSFKDGADAVMGADRQLFGGTHLKALCDIFQNRGFYQAADCDLPPAVGSSDTLVLLVNFKETTLTTDPIKPDPDAKQILDKINDYLKVVTYDKAKLNPTIMGWYTLPYDRAHYYDETAAHVLIDLVGDALALVAADPSFGGFSGVDRVLVITNDDGTGGVKGGDREYATTGPWPYTLPGALGKRWMSASVHRFNHTEPQFTHAIGHHFSLWDLYAYEGLSFPKPYADNWDNMAYIDESLNKSFNNAHFTVWNKIRGGWLDANSNNLRFIPRPPADPNPNHQFKETIPIYLQETATNETQVIQVGTTNGITGATGNWIPTERRDERVSYYIEARKTADPYDSNIPSDGVLVYYVNEDISQGYGPVRVVDKSPGDNDLKNAALGPNEEIPNVDGGTGLKIKVLPAQGSEAYRVEIDYDPPDKVVDVWIEPRDENWRSEDIWVDSPAGCNQGKCGFDKDINLTETDHGDKPKPGVPNLLYGRIHNRGPEIAHDVQIDFWLSEPWHAIDGTDTDPDTGGNTAFNKHFSRVIKDVPVGDNTPVYLPLSPFEWKPDAGPSGSKPHTCVKVKIQTPVGTIDTNDQNQVSQENIDEYDTVQGSPYSPVVNTFRVVNPYDHPILVYLRADDVPVGWTADVTPKKVWLKPKEMVDASIKIQPPQDYPVCSTEFVKATAWYPAGDTLVRLGGTAARVNLKTRTQLDVQTGVESCRKVVKDRWQSCASVTAKACTDPPRPNEHITLEYTGPDGKPVYHDVVTDAKGCFEDFYVDAKPGEWSVQASYPGNECTARAESPRRTLNVPSPGPFTNQWCMAMWIMFISSMIAAIVFLAMWLCSRAETLYRFFVATFVAVLLGWRLLTECNFDLRWFLISIFIAIVVAAFWIYRICFKRKISVEKNIFE